MRLASYVPSLTKAPKIREIVIQKEDNLQGPLTLSALCKVPSEIWHDIFDILCEGEHYPSCYSFHVDDTYPNGEWDTDSSGLVVIPKVLSHVCSRWRDIINNSPRLWSSIHIKVSDNLHPRIHIPLAVHLRNSKDHPLRLRIVPFNKYDVRQCIKRSTRKIFRLFSPHLWRCRMLDLHFVTLEGILATEKPPPFAFAHLTDVRVDMELDIDPTHTFWKALAEAPVLKKVEIQKLLGLNAIPYCRLTELHIQNSPHVDSLFRVLSACRSLQSLYLESFSARQYRELDYGSALVVLPSMRDMRVLISSYPSDLYPLFDKFVFPSLRKFHVGSSGDGLRMMCRPKAKWPPTFLQRFERSASHIEHLSLDFSELSLDDEDVLEILPILVMTPSVTHLEIQLSFQFGQDSTDDAARIGFLIRFLFCHITHFPLESGPESPVLLPKLTHLFLYDDSHRWWNIDLVRAVLEALESRSSLSLEGRTGVSPLSVFHLIYCDTSDRGLGLCDRLADVPGALELVREHEARHGMRCRLAHSTFSATFSGPHRDHFDPRFWTELDGELEGDFPRG